MNPGHWRKRYHSQRGAIGDTPETPRLADLMQQLEGLEMRVRQLKAGVANLVQLQQLQNAPPTDTQQSVQEIARLQETADNFELELASRIVSWQHLQEPFWQAVRFGGLGLLVGWVLAWFIYAQ
ncbi:DUF2203 domain-containing protein [Nodosilinea sp. LEGE 06152]|uniref:DUF2203 domain-containing protein n=1 Tax=Nodosilinea sp. LEGE 06152 TaxID=2777966 RepID=UPI0018806CFD|nr:DUF2203 domain-containing protein [Nodosilinea sp. LEGE 06152]MBE9159070.1 DUF2203 domain-containing protein [Nodosilinea sp. LEGE 06152]